MVRTEKTGPDRYEEEHSVGDYKVKIQRWGRNKNFEQIEIKRGLFFGKKKITKSQIDEINKEIEADTFPQYLGILVDSTSLERKHIEILDYCREIGWLPELKELEEPEELEEL